MGYNTKRWKDIQVPGSWELQGFDSPIYTDVAYPFPANPPHVPTDYNPVGAYVREFTVPAHWKGMDIFLDFEGVESAFYCWVNGKLAGYSEDSRLPAHFNITPFLKAGKNKLAVKVFRYSDGSYLEDQDYWKYSGIERDVYLYARPQSRVQDFKLVAGLTNGYKDGDFNLNITLHKPHPGGIVEVKIMDKGNVIYQHKKGNNFCYRYFIRSETLVPGHIALECRNTQSLYIGSQHLRRSRKSLGIIHTAFRFPFCGNA